ncbi:LysE family translocator [Halorubrum sp. GN11_10-6_MGM]|uniref:LysE family translocator n=1 Tax=Halorubrum sp. GN11_10-6_MGM TaxID=2518112 RepID=UPI0010F7322C|nr:LysE family translocator [Halorubrum sp. GN11_10-6_MGM]TKX72354.1 LysE family translocator [Halorubrum sp. GN11_10-6_MGM]
MSSLVSLGAGVVFGLALAAPPGPMNAVIAEESVLRGRLAGFRAGLGAATADAVFFLLAYVGVVAVVESFPLLRAGMVAVGGLLMLYFAVDAARGARASFRPTSGDEPAIEAGKGFRKALVLALTNPYQVLFWLTVGVGMIRPGELDVLSRLPVVGAELAGTFVVATGSPALIGGFFLGVLTWIVGFPAGLVAAERRIETFAPIVAVGSAVVLAGFGVYFLYDAATTVGVLSVLVDVVEAASSGP